MNILVINGSPKGVNSITYQTVRFLQNQFPKDEFKMLHAGVGMLSSIGSMYITG